MDSEHGRSIKDLRDALACAPDDVDAQMALAEACARHGVFGGDAIETYRRAAALTPHRPHLAAAFRIALMGREMDDMFITGGLGYGSGDSAGWADHTQVEESLSLLRAWRENHGDSGDLCKMFGDLFMLSRRFALATQAYRRARRLGFRPSAFILETIRRVSERRAIPGPPAVYFAEIALENGQDSLAETLLRGALTLLVPADERPDARDTSHFSEPAPQDDDYLERAKELLLDLLERRRGRATSARQRDRATLEMARLCLDRNDLTGAVARARQVDLYECEDKHLIKQLARHLAECCDYRQAFDFLRQLPLDSDVKDLLLIIRKDLEAIGEADTVAYLNEFIQGNPLVTRRSLGTSDRDRICQTQMAMGDFYLDNGRTEKALERYVDALEQGGDDSVAALRQIHAILETASFAPQVELLVRVGNYCVDHEDPEQASAFYFRALEMDTGNQDIRKRLRMTYDQLLAHNPNRPSIRLRSGDLYLMSGHFNQAVEEYRYSAQFPQSEGRATRRMITAYVKSKNLSLAVDCYESLTLEPEDLPPLRHLIRELEERRHYGEALRAATLLREWADEATDMEAVISRLEGLMKQSGQEAFLDPKMKQLIGDYAIGRYKYIEKIGSGGMGTVHRVRDLRRQEDVAMKILREGVAQSGKAVNRFFREARVAATLNHPNIVMIYDYNINPISGQSYIVMEYVEGISLRDRIEDRLDNGHEGTSATLAMDLYYCAQVCHALVAASERGIIHRDIKPDNILISGDNDVKLTDFGIMHVQDATFTPSGALVGTPRYMSPEQVEGKPIDGRSDLYSVAIILYELLVGAPPFVSGDVSYQQVHVAPTPPRDIYPDISASVNALVLKGLEKHPADRFQSAIEMAHALEAVMHDLPETGTREKQSILPRRRHSENETY